MIPAELARRAQELGARGEPYVLATVVRVAKPTSSAPGNVALVDSGGRLEGFVGGACAQQSVRVYSLQALEHGEPMLLRIVPDASQPATGADQMGELDAIETLREEGAVTVHNPCLSGGSIEVFLEPFLPAPRMVIAGDSPIAAALTRLGPEVGLKTVSAGGETAVLADDLALVVASHGHGELATLRAGLEAGLPYVGLVASRLRGEALIAELRQEGVPDDLLARIDTPAGRDIGARNPGEIAVSILSQVIAIRRRGAQPRAASSPAATTIPLTAVDPICGMTVMIDADTPRSDHGGQTSYFCCDGCRATFEERGVA